MKRARGERKRTSTTTRSERARHGLEHGYCTMVKYKQREREGKGKGKLKVKVKHGMRFARFFVIARPPPRTMPPQSTATVAAKET